MLLEKFFFASLLLHGSHRGNPSRRRACFVWVCLILDLISLVVAYIVIIWCFIVIRWQIKLKVSWVRLS